MTANVSPKMAMQKMIRMMMNTTTAILRYRFSFCVCSSALAPAMSSPESTKPEPSRSNLATASRTVSGKAAMEISPSLPEELRAAAIWEGLGLG